MAKMRERLLVVWLLGAALCPMGMSALAQEADCVHHEIAAWVGSLPAQWPATEAHGRTGSIVFRLSGEGGGVWHMRLADGKVTTGAGDIESPTAVIECTAADWLAILRGELGAQAAFLGGKLRVSGDLPFAIEFYSKLQVGTTASATNTDVSRWYTFEPLRIDYSAPAAMDASDLLDAPAGKHGFLMAKGNRFIFEDGTPARFWGAVIAGGPVFMDHEAAERAAARLARFGCNLVRLHHMDADWATPNIFDNSYDDTQHFSAESLDRLDYLVAQLKRRGIYVYLDLLVHRKFKAGDGVRDWQQVENGAKIIAHYSPRIIELQEKYARDLYTHVNKYTGLRYCDDPVIAMSEIINESSLFWAGGYDHVPPSYIAELDGLYRDWAVGKRKPASCSVVEGLRARNPDALQFLYETQVRYFTQIRDCLRSIGVKVPIAGSNHWEASALDLRSNSAMDYLDRHAYWDHPQNGYGPGARFENQPMVKSESWDLVNWLAPQRAADKPFIVSEWNCCWINEYIAEGPLVMAAYGAFQGWDGILQFDYTGADWGEQIGGNFDIGNKPHVFALWPAAARMFLRGDVQPGRVAVQTKWRVDDASGLGDQLPARASLRHRLAYTIAEAGEPGTKPLPVRLHEPAVTDTGELAWDADAGLVIVNTPSSVARIGFATGPVEAGPVTFEVTPEFAVVAVTALDRKPIRQSGRLLIVATARAENTGMMYGRGRRTATDAGHAPILMEPVVGTVRVAVDGSLKSARVHPLDPVGRPRGTVAAKVDERWLSVPLIAGAFWYEVVTDRQRLSQR